MCNLLLKPLIQRFKNQDTSVFSKIYEEFKKLIIYYSSKLCYEDAQADLNLFFIELLYSIDLSLFDSDNTYGIKRYIAVSLKNQYIALAVKEGKYKSYSLPLFENANGYFGEFDDKILLCDAMSRLTGKQKSIVTYKYIYGYTVTEISKKFGVSRQTFNDTKNRALSCLKNFLKE